MSDLDSEFCGFNSHLPHQPLIELVKTSVSFAQLINKLGLKQAGGTHSNLKRKLTKLGIDFSHFTGKSSIRGRVPSNKRKYTEILVLRYVGYRQPTLRLRRALIESGVEYICSLCFQPPIWNGKPLTLEVDHINNNWLDDRKSNLRFLCGHCHSQQLHKNNKGKTGVLGLVRNYTPK